MVLRVMVTHSGEGEEQVPSPAPRRKIIQPSKLTTNVTVLLLVILASA